MNPNQLILNDFGQNVTAEDISTAIDKAYQQNGAVSLNCTGGTGNIPESWKGCVVLRGQLMEVAGVSPIDVLAHIWVVLRDAGLEMVD